ncbi:magnesium/cobalt transporter CorA [Oceaniglobus ichthyenteri]|uniref:magnesium/cobalt transporter CorA n=1 Tax=Oceaniglobus ichthyenteri TaxID=2136177 RepID=UPI000D399C26|nr:magnesium/cobalt transporter CorA [Oceaniglobus ichthyenteri]
MIRTFAFADARLNPQPDQPTLSQDATWIDVFDPSPDEMEQVEKFCGFPMPTPDDMAEIEISSRLYEEFDAVFMTALIPSRTDTDDLLMKPVTFILTNGRLITIRYHDPRVFAAFITHCTKTKFEAATGEGVMLQMLDIVVDRLADILERAGHELDRISSDVFARKETRSKADTDYKATLESIGRKGNFTSNLRDSLMTLSRLVTFLEPRIDRDTARQSEILKTLSQDIRSLLDHCGFVSQKVTFLLDATLGLIGIEQNGIIKIFSVAAVIFLPPTVVASIYGMNFEIMPELAFPYGYPMALGLMLMSSIVPYLFFKRRGWL